ncbi:hypothetical protein LMA04_01950 [Pseudescherichia vulneris]|uniref:hypothetical protein n=1 Tax=Pseudescherichia vulneris TaxID=566 RepID=UPI00227AE7F4|nr:hypothetical protein [Pseudescherichia vulneris]WAH52846.1 hypothetical protein LMA04_01950 [Pseudescherichia vulneris]
MQEAINVLLTILPIVALFTLITLFTRTLRQPKRIISDENGMKKISSNPSYFGGSSRAEYYYDDTFLYEIKNNITHKIELSKITQVKPGYTTINNRRKWSVIYLTERGESQMQFYHNLTLFNQNFTGFLAAVERENPNAEVRKLSFFNM